MNNTKNQLHIYFSQKIIVSIFQKKGLVLYAMPSMSVREDFHDGGTREFMSITIL